MSPLEIVLLVLGIVVAILVVLYFVGRKLQKKQDEANAAMEQQKQTVNAFIIDKKKMKLKDANFPAAAMKQVPWYMKNSKMPMAKVKIGPQIITMICDPAVFKTLPTKKSLNITIAGAYITAYSTGKKGDKKAAPAKPLTGKEKREAKRKARQAKRAAEKAAKAAK